MTDIGELVVRIKADAAQLQSEMNKASGVVKQSSNDMALSLNTVKQALGVLGIAFGAEAMIEFGKSALEAANDMYIMGQRTGFAASTLSALNIPLKQNGSNIDEFASSMKFLNRNVELAYQGNKELLDVFSSLGISVTKLKQLSPEEQFYTIAQALGQIKDQGKFTTDAMAIMGRGAAGLIPIIKSTNGNLADMVKKIKDVGGALTDEEIKKVHEYDDAWISFWEHMKIHTVEAIVALDEFMKLSMPGTSGINPNVSTTRPQTVNEISHDPSAIDKALRDRGLPGLTDTSASGNNNDLVGRTKAQTAEVSAFIKKLQDESSAAEISGKALYERQALIEANSKALTDYNNGLRDTGTLTDDETTAVDAAAGALYDHKQALAENKKMADQLASSLTDVAMNFHGIQNAIKSLLDSIAKEIIQSKISNPLSQSLTGLFSGGVGNIFSNMPGFADGGSPPVGMPSIVGENGPEIFVPSQSGTVIPNGAMGGNTVHQTLVFNMQPGLAETVGVAIRGAAPQIASMAHASIIQAMNNGGADSRVIGRRA